MHIQISILALTLTVLFNEVAAQVRKCLDDKDCHADECCAQAFYLFRCEKRGFSNGDSCGLCGCSNGLTCSSDGLSPFRILSGRGACRYSPQPVPQPRPPGIPKPRPQIVPGQRPEPTRPPVNCNNTIPGKTPIKIKPDSNWQIRKPGKNHFYETFQPIYEQFVELAISAAGITLDDTTDTATVSATTEISKE